MSAWGYYDDENDDVVMEFSTIIDEDVYNEINPPAEKFGTNVSHFIESSDSEKFGPSVSHFIESSDSKISYQALTEKIRSYIRENKERTEKIFIRHILRIMNDETDEYRYKTVIGIALTLAKMMANVEIQCQPFNGIPPASNLNLVLDKNFPEKITDIAINCIQKTIKEWQDEMPSKDGKKRIAALKQELYLFSDGKLGEKGDIIQNNFNLID